jgi:hypothetical protein
MAGSDGLITWAWRGAPLSYSLVTRERPRDGSDGTRRAEFTQGPDTGAVSV